MNTNEIKELIVKDNKNAVNDGKRLVCYFIMKNGKTKTTKFGMYKSAGTYADGATDEKRNQYIGRHQKRENWKDIFSAGSLSRFVLWEFRSNNDIEKFYNRQFKIPKVKIQFKRYKKDVKKFDLI